MWQVLPITSFLCFVTLFYVHFIVLHRSYTFEVLSISLSVKCFLLLILLHCMISTLSPSLHASCSSCACIRLSVNHCTNQGVVETLSTILTRNFLLFLICFKNTGCKYWRCTLTTIDLFMAVLTTVPTNFVGIFPKSSWSEVKVAHQVLYKVANNLNDHRWKVRPTSTILCTVYFQIVFTFAFSRSNILSQPVC